MFTCAVGSYIRVLQFEYSLRQIYLLSTHWKDENEGKEAGNGPIFENVRSRSHKQILE